MVRETVSCFFISCKFSYTHDFSVLIVPDVHTKCTDNKGMDFTRCRLYFNVGHSV